MDASPEEVHWSEFQEALHQMANLPDFAREVLLVRHMLRTLQDGEVIEELMWLNPNENAPLLCRTLVIVLSENYNFEDLINTKYGPPNKAETHSLLLGDNEFTFEVSIAAGRPEINFGFGKGSLGFDYSSDIADENRLLIAEVHLLRGSKKLRESVKLLKGTILRPRVESTISNKQSFFSDWHVENPSIGPFWKELFEVLYEGGDLDQELLDDVAGIGSHIWQSDAMQLAIEIERIRSKLQLLARVSKLETELKRLATHETRLGIGGNNPPEDMQIEPQIVRETTIIWAAVDELEAETEKEAPDKSAVLRIIETLGRALKAILAWLAEKGDLGVDTLIKWGIPIGGATVLANPKLVADVIEAAKAWVPFLP